MPFGYHGKILHVDLSHGSLAVEEPSEDFYRTYMGGSALGLYYLLKFSPPNIDPLGPDNLLILALSVLTGAPISGQSRMTAIAKSPLTNAVGDSQSGGFFPAEMKFSGYDAIVIRGKAKRPVYLWLHDGEAEIRPADHLWGKITGEVDTLLKKELKDDRIQIAQCGPAGEKLVRFAAIMNMANRANGRTGMGAIMGSKNLKAVAVKGNQRPQLADRSRLIELARWGADHIEESDVLGLGLFGTAEVMNPQNRKGGQASYNWSSGYFENANALDGTTMAKSILMKRDTCYSCSIRCKRVVEVNDESQPVHPNYGGPEYETLSTFGTYCGIDDLKSVAYANQLCNMYGLDTISCGATIAWAMDCYEQGIITKEDTDGIDLRFGNVNAMIRMVELIARREGFGNILAEGSARAAEVIGRGAEELVVAVKGQELPAHMPQVKRSLALIYAVNPYGADHQSSEHDPSYTAYPKRMEQLGLINPQPADVLNFEKVWFALTTQYAYSCLDTLNICQFVFGSAWQLFELEQLVQATRAITGWDVDLNELLTVGERRLNLLRAYNAREGIGRNADILPNKLYKALKGGKTDGIYITSEELEQAKDWYYALAGWDSTTGKPTRKTLEKLGLNWVADELRI
jgi:aldehyde:ferredoxin oxidoreductase